MVAAWAGEGIGTELVLRVPDRLPGLYLIRTDAAGERSFFYWRDSAPVRGMFTPAQAEMVEDAICRAGMVYLSGITLSLFQGSAREVLFHLLARARRAGVRVTFDTNFRPRGWPDRAEAQAAYDRAFAVSDIVLAGMEDYALLYGGEDPQDAIRRLRDAGVGEAVVKCVYPACHVTTGGVTELVAADTIDAVVDTTAAGDSFAAGYLAASAAGYAAPDAARAGHRLAGTVIRFRGAIIPRHAMPSDILQAPK